VLLLLLLLLLLVMLLLLLLQLLPAAPAVPEALLLRLRLRLLRLRLLRLRLLLSLVVLRLLQRRLRPHGRQLRYGAARGALTAACRTKIVRVHQLIFGETLHYKNWRMIFFEKSCPCVCVNANVS